MGVSRGLVGLISLLWLAGAGVCNCLCQRPLHLRQKHFGALGIASEGNKLGKVRLLLLYERRKLADGLFTGQDLTSCDGVEMMLVVLPARHGALPFPGWG